MDNSLEYEIDVIAVEDNYVFYKEYSGKTYYDGRFTITCYQPTNLSNLPGDPLLIENKIYSQSKYKILLKLNFKKKIRSKIKSKDYYFISFLFENSMEKIISKVLSHIKFKTHYDQIKKAIQGKHSNPETFLKYLRKTCIRGIWKKIDYRDQFFI